jgi:mannose-6-phosphate isomerase-like protein (cupin superfamily)
MDMYTVGAGPVLLCDTPLCHAEVCACPGDSWLSGAVVPRVEVVLCVLTGRLEVSIGDTALALGPRQGVQVPAGQHWKTTGGAEDTVVLRVDSPHPGFAPGRATMPLLQHPHRFAVAEGGRLVYTDYVRGGVLVFAPGFAAERHYHQDAEEIFWFVSGTCRVGAPGGTVVVPAGTVIYTPAGEWHVIENAGDAPLVMFLTVTPNIVPSHTFFAADGTPEVRSWVPLTRP